MIYDARYPFNDHGKVLVNGKIHKDAFYCDTKRGFIKEYIREKDGQVKIKILDNEKYMIPYRKIKGFVEFIPLAPIPFSQFSIEMQTYRALKGWME